jgi:ketosteroid isomerase-like protein
MLHILTYVRGTVVLVIACALAVPFVTGQSSGPTESILKALIAAFNAHDLDKIMTFFGDDCELRMPRGKEPYGQRYVGKAAVRAGLASRFEGIPDVRYTDDKHWISGNIAVSSWLLTGTTKAGEPVRVRGIDLLEFRNGKITMKDSYWKIVDK